MPELYDVAAPKKATNVSLNSDLLQKARSLKINLSARFGTLFFARLCKSSIFKEILLMLLSL